MGDDLPDISPHTATFQLWYLAPNTARTDTPTKIPIMAKVILTFIKQDEGGIGGLILVPVVEFRNKCQNYWEPDPDQLNSISRNRVNSF